MTSPFPGMDPYLEAHWGDVHTSLVTYARDQLSKQLPPDLKARVEENVAVQVEDELEGGFFPDVRVIERPDRSGERPATSSDTALAEPLIVPMQLEPETHRRLLVIDRSSGNRIVTAVEVLSPSNKAGETGRQAFRKKQREMLQAGVNLVEVDLLREGQYAMSAPAQCVPLTHRSPYRICVVRGSRPDQAEVYRLSLRERLPAIHIPLRETDEDAVLDLQSLIDQAFENGGYGDDLDYRLDPQPPLRGDDATWADALLKEKGLR